jgi:hypothetical protein
MLIGIKIYSQKLFLIAKEMGNFICELNQNYLSSSIDKRSSLFNVKAAAIRQHNVQHKQVRQGRDKGRTETGYVSLCRNLNANFAHQVSHQRGNIITFF